MLAILILIILLNSGFFVPVWLLFLNTEMFRCLKYQHLYHFWDLGIKVPGALFLGLVGLFGASTPII